MRETVWKFPLAFTGEQTVSAPLGAKPLALQWQEDVPTLWALVDVPAPARLMRVVMVGTGHPVPHVPRLRDDETEYLGTLQQPPFVWHFFWRPDFTPIPEGDATETRHG